MLIIKVVNSLPSLCPLLFQSREKKSERKKLHSARTPHIPLLPVVFKACTYVVSQLEVFLARQLIVHSFDQLQDLQREESGKEEREGRKT